MLITRLRIIEQCFDRYLFLLSFVKYTHVFILLTLDLNLEPKVYISIRLMNTLWNFHFIHVTDKCMIVPSFNVLLFKHAVLTYRLPNLKIHLTKHLGMYFSLASCVSHTHTDMVLLLTYYYCCSQPLSGS